MATRKRKTVDGKVVKTYVISFYYTNSKGEKVRYRKKALVQTHAGAKAEEQRVRMCIAEHGEPHKPPTDCLTLKQFVDEYWEDWTTTHHKPNTQVAMRDRIKRETIPAFGHLPMSEITTEMLHKFAAQIASRRVDPGSAIKTVASVLKSAVTLGKLSESPKMPKLRRAVRKLPNCLDDEQFWSIMGVVDGWLKVAVALAGLAGLRSGEIRALEVRDIDWKRNRIMVRHAMSREVKLSTKTDRERIVPIWPDLAPILREASEGKEPGDGVVMTRFGAIPCRNIFGQRLAHVLAMHGLPRVRPHMLRHYFLSTLLSRGATVEQVRMVAGHSDIATTGIYLHAGVDDVFRYMGTRRSQDSDWSVN